MGPLRLKVLKAIQSISIKKLKKKFDILDGCFGITVNVTTAIFKIWDTDVHPKQMFQ